MKKTFSILEAISFGWHTFKSNWKFWIVASLIVGMATGSSNLSSVGNLNRSSSTQTSSVTKTLNQDLPYPEHPVDYNSVLGVSHPIELDPPSIKQESPISNSPVLTLIPYIIVAFILFLAVGVVGALISIVFRMGYINLTLDAARNKDVYYKTILNQVSLKKAWRFLVVQMRVFILVFLGFVFFIIPGIILALRYSMVSFALVDLDKTPSEAMKMSRKLTNGVKLKLLGLWFVSGLVIMLGLLAFGVGVMPASIVVSLAYAYVYNKLLEQSESANVSSSPSVPPIPSIDVPFPSSTETPSVNSGNLLAEN